MNNSNMGYVTCYSNPYMNQELSKTDNFYISTFLHMDVTLNTCGWCKDEEIMEQTIIQFFFMV